jgi:hypothetical protein
MECLPGSIKARIRALQGARTPHIFAQNVALQRHLWGEMLQESRTFFLESDGICSLLVQKCAG